MNVVSKAECLRMKVISENEGQPFERLHLLLLVGEVDGATFLTTMYSFKISACNSKDLEEIKKAPYTF